MDDSTPRIIAGIDIGGTNVRCALSDVDDPHHTLAWRTADTPEMDGPEPLIRLIESELAACRREADIEPGALVTVGCVTPGIVDRGTGTVQTASNLGGWTDVPLAALLEEALNVPVRLENDVNAAALAEYQYGAGAGCASLVYLTISTGVAAGIVVGGTLLRGFHHAAGEVGFMVSEAEHLGRSWEGNGCLEQTAAGVGLARAWAAVQGGSGAPASAVEVFDAARDGSEEAVALVERAADYLAMMAVALGAIIDPEVLVLGGSIARNEPRITDRIRQVSTQMLPYPPRILDEYFAGRAPLIGALTMAARQAAAVPGASVHA